MLTGGQRGGGGRLDARERSFANCSRMRKGMWAVAGRADTRGSFRPARASAIGPALASARRGAWTVGARAGVPLNSSPCPTDNTAAPRPTPNSPRRPLSPRVQGGAHVALAGPAHSGLPPKRRGPEPWPSSSPNASAASSSGARHPCPTDNTAAPRPSSSPAPPTAFADGPGSARTGHCTRHPAPPAHTRGTSARAHLRPDAPPPQRPTRARVVAAGKASPELSPGQESGGQALPRRRARRGRASGCGPIPSRRGRCRLRRSSGPRRGRWGPARGSRKSC